MRGLSGKAAKSMAVRLAALHHIGEQRIYKLTEDLRPSRAKRSDKGKRAFEIVEGTDVWTAAQLVIVDKLDPDQALLTCRTRGLTKLPSLETFQRMLREKNLGKKQRRSAKRAFRRWEAEHPGELFQIDVTALKVRWQDEKTRRILRIEGVDKNHPQMDPSKLRVWQIMLVDDHSRRRFLRYIATTHITSLEMVRFECEAFEKLGIPHTLYTDNGSEFKGYHLRAAKILNNILEKDGGYRHQTHAPGNSQASGKVENAHQWAEKMDRLVGLAVSEGQIVTIDSLNLFADRVCEAYDNRKHRTTNEKPIVRWHAKKIVVRKLPKEIIESALMSDEFEVALDPSMTVAYKGTAYKVPNCQPFVNYIGQKVKIVVPPSIDLILITLPDGSEFELEKIVATADKAGEFKSTAESVAQDLTKRLKASRKEEIKAIKEKKKLTGEIAPVPHYNVPIEIPATNITHFPHPERVVSAEEVNAVTPIVQAPAYDPSISYWQAVAEFSSSFPGGIDEAKEFLLAVFPNASGEIAKSDVEAAIGRRHEKQRLLRAV
jgi:transposase InsO family protein